MKSTKMTSRLWKRREALRKLASDRVVWADTEVTSARATEAMEALHRVDTGTYGVCTDCGEKIPAARLRAKPEAIRCVECQIFCERSLGTPLS